MINWRKSKKYRKWRIQVIRRDKVCQICNSRKHREAHHMNHASYYPNDRYDVDNGITLCKKCHSHYHCDYHNSFREKCSKKDFYNFLSLVKYFKKLFLPNR